MSIFVSNGLILNEFELKIAEARVSGQNHFVQEAIMLTVAPVTPAVSMGYM